MTEDVWTDRTKALTEFFTKVGFAAAAFFSILFCVMWYAIGQQDIERTRSIEEQATDKTRAETERTVAEAHVNTLNELARVASEQRDDFKELLVFSKGVNEDLLKAATERQNVSIELQKAAENASAERQLMMESLRTIAEILQAQYAAKNPEVQPDPGGT